jgi:hypothetical protein
MLSRALILAAVTVVLGCFAAIPADAQNLEAGKSPGQIFSATCSLCHKSPRGLLKSVAPGSLPGFLRQHYTTSSDMASAMSAYVMSNGAANAPVGGGNLTRQGQESRSAPKPSAEPAPERAVQERERAAKGRRPHGRDARPPDADGLPDGAGAPSEAPASAEAPPAEQHPGAKQKGRQKAAKGRPAKDEPPKIDARHEAPKEEPPKSEPPKAEPEKSDSAKTEAPAAEAPKREEASPSMETKPDPVPAATPTAPKEPEKGPAVVAPASKPVDDNPNRPLTIDIGPPPAPPPAPVPADAPTAPASK